MPKLTIYVPDDLAEAVKNSGMSVSPVCQQALRFEVRRTEAMKVAADGEDKHRAAARRLLDERTTNSTRPPGYGWVDGMAWAQETATESELRALAAIDADDGWTTLRIDPEDWPTLHEQLHGTHQGDTLVVPRELYVELFVKAAVLEWTILEAEMAELVEKETAAAK